MTPSVPVFYRVRVLDVTGKPFTAHKTRLVSDGDFEQYHNGHITSNQLVGEHHDRVVEILSPKLSANT